MSTPLQEEAAKKQKSSLTTKNMLYGSAGLLFLGGGAIITFWAFSDRNSKPAKISSSKVGGGLRTVATPISSEGNQPRQYQNLASDFKKDDFDDVKAGKIKFTGDTDGSKAHSLTTIANAPNVTANFLDQLSKKFNPVVSMKAPEGLSTEELAVFNILVTNHPEELKKAFSKGAAPPHGKEVKVEDTEERNQAQEAEAVNNEVEEAAKKAAQNVEETPEQKEQREEAERKAGEDAKNKAEIDLSALQTDEQLTTAFGAINSENFSVKATTADATFDDDLKAALIDAVKNKGLSEALFKKLLLEQPTTADEDPILVELRKTTLVGPLKIKPLVPPSPESIFIDLLTKFNTQLTEQCTKYESGAAPDQTEKDDLASKLSALIEGTKKLDPATVDASQTANVAEFKAEPTLEALFSKALLPKLESAVKACKNDATEVQKLLVATLKCCPAAFISAFGADVDAADKIADVKLRLVVYGEVAEWAGKPDLSVVMNNLAVSPIDNALKAALLALDNQLVYQHCLENPDEATKNCIIEAAALKAKIVAYPGQDFDTQEESDNAHAALVGQLTDFSNSCAVLAPKVNLLEPVKKELPNKICSDNFQQFIAAFEEYFRNPDVDGLPAIQKLLEKAQVACNLAGVTSKPADINQTLVQFAQEKYNALWNQAIATGNPNEAQVQVFLTAFQGVDSTFHPEDDAATLLCNEYRLAFEDSLSRTNVAHLRENYNLAKKFCLPADYESFAAESIEKYYESVIEHNLENILNPANNPTIEHVEEIYADIEILRELEPVNKFSHFTGLNDFIKYLNFMRTLPLFMSAKQAFLDSSPLTSAQINQFQTAYIGIKGFHPLAGSIPDNLSPDIKPEYDLVGILKGDFDQQMRKMLFDKLEPQLENEVLGLLPGVAPLPAQSEAIEALIGRMRMGCKEEFEKVFPGVEGLHSVDDKLDDLKLFIVRYAFRRGEELPLSVPLKNALSASLANPSLKLRAGMDFHLQMVMTHLVEYEQLLKAYFVEDNESDKNLIGGFLLSAGKYLKNLETYNNTCYIFQKVADNDFNTVENHLNAIQSPPAILSDIINAKPFPKLERKFIEIPSICVGPNQEFVAAFEIYLENPEDGDLKNKAEQKFNLATGVCNSVANPQKIGDIDFSILNIYQGNFDNFKLKYYYNLLKQAANADNLGESSLQKLRIWSKNDPNNTLEAKFKVLFKSNFNNTNIDYAVTKALCSKWQTIFGKDISKLIKGLIIEQKHASVWKCLVDSDDKSFEKCHQTNQHMASLALNIYEFKPQETANSLISQMFAKSAGTNFFDNYVKFFTKTSKDIETMLVSFKRAATRISGIFPEKGRSAELKCWMEAIKSWNPPTGLLNTFWSLVGTPEDNSHLFFKALLEKYWESSDQALYKKIDDLINQCSMKFEKFSKENGRVRFIDKFKNTSIIASLDLTKITTAIENFDSLSALKQYLQVWKEHTPRELTSAFYKALISADEVDLQTYDSYLKENARPRTIKSLVIPAFNPFLPTAAEDFNIDYAKFKKLLEEFVMNPTVVKKNLLEAAYNLAKLSWVASGIHESDLSNPLEQILIDRFMTALNEAYLYILDQKEIDALERTLSAVQLVKPDYLAVATVKSLLCTHHKMEFLEIMKKPEDHTTREAHVSFEMGKKCCPLGDVQFQSPSLVDWIEKDIYNLIGTGIHADADKNAIRAKIEFLNSIEPNNTYSEVKNDVDISNQVELHKYIRLATDYLPIFTTKFNLREIIEEFRLKEFHNLMVEMENKDSEYMSKIRDAHLKMWLTAMKEWTESKFSSDPGFLYFKLLSSYMESKDPAITPNLFSLMMFTLKFHENAFTSQNNAGTELIEILNHQSIDTDADAELVRKAILVHKDLKLLKSHLEVWQDKNKEAKMNRDSTLQFVRATPEILKCFSDYLNGDLKSLPKSVINETDFLVTLASNP